MVCAQGAQPSVELRTGGAGWSGMSCSQCVTSKGLSFPGKENAGSRGTAGVSCPQGTEQPPWLSTCRLAGSTPCTLEIGGTQLLLVGGQMRKPRLIKHHTKRNVGGEQTQAERGRCLEAGSREVGGGMGLQATAMWSSRGKHVL